MKIKDLIKPGSILVGFEAADKGEALSKLAEEFAKLNPSVDAGKLKDALAKREALGSTGIGGGVAVPHASYDGIERTTGMFAVSKKEIDFQALDGKGVHFIFLFVYSGREVGERVKVLARVARLLQHKLVHKLILSARKPEQVMEIFVANDMVSGN
ncbi:MAG: PTS sugar transporter subunit IIA [Candidatus Omnitrophica bacterium]|nr:PTS sugar transporter subunit IIA [Candidatus Omnitrophota bacterium]